MTHNIGILEICCGDIDSVISAREGGADRVELCSALEAGGLTPSAGLMLQAVKQKGAMLVNVLIRPREGDFVYTPEEVEIMIEDIATACRCGADGVVIGALNEEGSVDTATCRRLIEAAGDMTVTFHRAFDVCSNPRQALEQIIELGCDTLLTSGCACSAMTGAKFIRQLTVQSDGRIAILAGAGVNPDNASELLDIAGVNQLHASARSLRESGMKFRNEKVSMGNPYSDEYSRMVTDANKVRILSKIIHQTISQ